MREQQADQLRVAALYGQVKQGLAWRDTSLGITTNSQMIEIRMFLSELITLNSIQKRETQIQNSNSSFALFA